MLSPEFRLIVACCVWPAGDSRNARISAAMTAPLDWDLFLKVVKRHRVSGLAMYGILSHSDLVPRPVIDALEVAAARQVNKSLVLAGETFRLTRLLQKGGIPVACLKGAPLSILAFGNLGLRHSKDIDLLVDPANALEGDRLLQAAGYEITMPKGPHSEEQKRHWMQLRKHFEYRHRLSGIQLELHWRLFDNTQFFAGSFTLASCIPIAIADGMTVPALARRDLLLYLCVHGANHMWFRLRWIADVSALLSQQNSDDLPRLFEDARMRGCVHSVTQALLLSRLLFSVPTEAYRIPTNRAAERLVDTALDAMTQREAAVELEEIPFGTSRIAFARYRLKRNWKFWAREAQLGLVDELDRDDTHVPQSFSFLLPLLRIPLWLTRRLLHGGRSNR